LILPGFSFGLINAIQATPRRNLVLSFFHHLKGGRKRDWKADEFRASFYSCRSLSLRRSFFMGDSAKVGPEWRALSRTDALFDLSPLWWLIGRHQLV
jgi:hypothetical protein